jgi:hypothetical protein
MQTLENELDGAFVCPATTGGPLTAPQAPMQARDGIKHVTHAVGAKVI